jgi:hypothetical protein
MDYSKKIRIVINNEYEVIQESAVPPDQASEVLNYQS